MNYMSETERGRKLLELEAKIDSLHDEIKDTQILADLAKEYHRLSKE